MLRRIDGKPVSGRLVYRPERQILVSPKVQQLIESEKLKGCEVEVVHLV
jgi:hypothetical protein